MSLRTACRGRALPARRLHTLLFPGLLTVALACSGAPAGEPVTGDDPDALVVRGTELLETGRTEAALAHFERADELSGGTSAEAALGLALAAYDLFDFGRAIAEAARTLDLAETDAQRARALNTAGLARLALARELTLSIPAAALRWATKKDDPADRPGTAEPAAAREAELERAADAFRRAAALAGGEDGVPRTNLAESLFRLGRLEEARQALAPALAAGPGGELPPGAERLARCLRLLEDQDFIYSLAGPAAGDGGGDPAVEPPQRIDSPQPRFPRHARSNAGDVLVEAIVDTQGRVVCPRVVSASAVEFAEATVQVLPGWRFEPARREGAPVAVYYHLTTHFRRDP